MSDESVGGLFHVFGFCRGTDKTLRPIMLYLIVTKIKIIILFKKKFYLGHLSEKVLQSEILLSVMHIPKNEKEINYT